MVLILIYKILLPVFLRKTCKLLLKYIRDSYFICFEITIALQDIDHSNYVFAFLLHLRSCMYVRFHSSSSLLLFDLSSDEILQYISSNNSMRVFLSLKRMKFQGSQLTIGLDINIYLFKVQSINKYRLTRQINTDLGVTNLGQRETYLSDVHPFISNIYLLNGV